MQLKQELGKNIQRYRKLNNITQEKLAELIDVEINSISSVERGRYFPSPDNLVKLAAALNVEISDLFRFKDEMTNEDYLAEIQKNLALIKDEKVKLSAVNDFLKNLLLV